ncbi:sperm acrosome developmental regulator isoform X2 [Pteronotus mesoamericanus]|uniref:sperm acrosome developmental regulator isoform X2 n=1 Tax=Pteronotus mesoamericanus TaxID=1884717 RepID=UPI0023EC6AF5|nr:sperm acrosome developmental regulator isoform X2 [Pteronotus parnellii mesoamericanus]
MVAVMRFFRWVWRKITYWVLFWKHKAKPTKLEHPDTKKNALKVEMAPDMDEILKLVEPPKEAKVSKMEVSPSVADPCALAKKTDGAKVELDRGGRSLLQLPLLAVKSVSTIMVSALQSGWQMCSWKSSVSSTSVPSQMRTGSPLQSPEAEMLREVYLVLWAIRKQLRQLARRQERCRRRHICAHTCPQPDPAQDPKQAAQSPL